MIYLIITILVISIVSAGVIFSLSMVIAGLNQNIKILKLEIIALENELKEANKKILLANSLQKIDKGVKQNEKKIIDTIDSDYNPKLSNW
jgi:cell division protein FtsL